MEERLESTPEDIGVEKEQEKNEYSKEMFEQAVRELESIKDKYHPEKQDEDQQNEVDREWATAEDRIKLFFENGFSQKDYSQVKNQIETEKEEEMREKERTDKMNKNTNKLSEHEPKRMHCSFCGSNKHTDENCPKTARGYENRGKMHCSFCGSNQHYEIACPKTHSGSAKRAWSKEKISNYYIED